MTNHDDYKLLQRIGVGGMGEVWMADQEWPVRRRVAIKLIRSQLDERLVIARFEAERQALALGVAEFRLENYDAAIASLERALAIHRQRESDGWAVPGDLAFLALCHLRLEHSDKALGYLQQYEEAVQAVAGKKEENAIFSAWIENDYLDMDGELKSAFGSAPKKD